MKTRKFLLAATAAMTALLFGLTSCEDKGGLTVSPNYVTIYVGETQNVTASSGGTALDASSVTWTSNNPEIFSIENGVITGLAVGQSTFTATYNDQSVTGDVIVSEALPEAPIVDPVANGITLVVHIPTGTNCEGAPLWAGNNTDYGGQQMTAIENADGWYKIDFADLESMQGKVLAAFKGWESDLGSWETQWIAKSTTIMEETNATAKFVSDQGQDALNITSTGIVYLNIEKWQTNPCGLSYEGEFTITVNLPECTPADAQIHFVGTPAALGWDDGQIVEIVTDETGAKTATLVVSGKNTDSFKVKLDGAGADAWSRQGVYCNNGEVSAYDNEPLGSTEEEVYTKTFTVEGWGDNGAAIEGCLTDCAVTPAE